MRIEADSRSQWFHGLRAVDKETGKVIPKVRWADTDTGTIGLIRCGTDGLPEENPDDSSGFLEDVETGREFRIAHLDDLDETLAETA